MRPSNITSELTSGAARTRPQRKLKVGVLLRKIMKTFAILAALLLVGCAHFQAHTGEFQPYL